MLTGPGDLERGVVHESALFAQAPSLGGGADIEIQKNIIGDAAGPLGRSRAGVGAPALR